MAILYKNGMWNFPGTVCVLLAAASLPEKAERAYEKGRYHEAVSAYAELAEKAAPESRGEYLKRLAESYYKDQEHEKAFTVYLSALDAVQPQKTAYQPSAEDERLYQEALKIYLDPAERDPELTALKIKDLYAGILRLHPDYFELGFLVAASYANLNEIEKFFEIFFRSYKELPDHYMAYKTKAILHLKLFDRGRTVEEKEKQRDLVLASLQEAKKRYPKDTTIYRLQIAFAHPAQKEEILKRNLKEILDQSIVIPRSDLSFYFDQLFAFREKELASALLVKARIWYPYSRTLDAAKEMIEEEK